MSVCNIFKPIGDAESIFYTFSEWGNSIAGVMAGGGLQESTPSRFILLRLPDSSITDAYKWLQCWYDDLCCRMRDNGMSLKERAAVELPALMQGLEERASLDVSAPVYTGSIDIISTESTGGMDYCDCVCWVGPDGKRNAAITKGTDTTAITKPADKTYISGYETEDSRRPGVSTAGYDTLLAEKNIIYNYTIDTAQPTDEPSFDFNAVLVLFDVRAGDTVISGIPMGIYLTKTPVTKQCSSSTIYGQGTSWSLKVGMRWANTVDGSAFADADVDPKGEYGSFLACIDRMNTTIDYMNAMTLAFNKMYNNVTDIIYSHLGALDSSANATYWKSFRNEK